jgi:hypothetical protein
MFEISGAHYFTSDDNGCASPRNCMLRCHGATVAPAYITSLPFGQGTSVFAIGKQNKFMQHLQDSPAAAVATLATRLAAMLPPGCPRECRVQLCLHANNELPLLQRNVANDNVVLVVTGFDPDECERARQTMIGQTIAQIFEGREPLECATAARDYRRCIARDVLRMLEEEYTVEIPESVRVNDAVFDTMDFAQLHLVRDPVSDWFLIGADMNIGSEACVFHSPTIGYTIFTQNVPNPIRWTVPSSSGSTINLGEQSGELPKVEKSLTCDNLPEFLRLLQTDHTIPDSVAIQPPPDCQNQSINMSAYSVAYDSKDVMPPNAETRVVTLHALATGISTATRPNGRISAILPCVTLHEMIEFTTSTHVIVPNSAEWQAQLTSIDPAHRPFALMNASTSIFDKGIVVAFQIPKEILT